VGDALRHPVRWLNRSWAELTGKPVMLRLHLYRATVYAVYVSVSNQGVITNDS